MSVYEYSDKSLISMEKTNELSDDRYKKFNVKIINLRNNLTKEYYFETFVFGLSENK